MTRADLEAENDGLRKIIGRLERKLAVAQRREAVVVARAVEQWLRENHPELILETSGPSPDREGRSLWPDGGVEEDRRGAEAHGAPDLPLAERMNPVIEHAIRTGARVDYDMAGSAMVMDGPHEGAMVGINDLLCAYHDTVAELQRVALNQTEVDR